jgi:alanine racemase
MLFSELAVITNGRILSQIRESMVNKFTIDSRKLNGQPSEVFVAIKGTRNDAHAFMQQAFDQGVRNFIVEQSNGPNLQANILLVDSSVRALQAIAKAHRKQYDYPVVAITGSNGKTTVKEWLSELISSDKKVVKSPKSFNSQVGVPLSVMDMGQHDVAVFEAGISQVNEMQYLADVIQPTLGIFTNIGEAHGQGFSSITQKIQEKCQLFTSAKQVICRLEYVNIIKELGKLSCDITTWSLQDDDANYAFELADGRYLLKGDSLQFQLPFTNQNQVENALNAVVAAKKLGITNESIQNSVALFRAVPMRLELKRAIHGCYVIDDSYNNDYVGLEVALDFMNQQNPHQKKAVIISDILQSSLPDKELYGLVEQLMKSKGVDRFFVVGDRISRHFPNNSFKSTDELIANLTDFQNETVLIKGARSFEFERIVSQIQDQSHGTVLEINFEALRNNLNAYRSLLKPNCKMMVMVKAFAYGAGLTEIASFLQHQRVDYLGVAYVDEAVQLRNKGITLPILIMNPEEVQFETFERYNLEAEIFNMTNLERLIRSKCNVGVHLKLETGMNRLGFTESELNEVIKLIGANTISLKGIFTHFSSSDSNEEDSFTHHQANSFERMMEKLAPLTKGQNPLVHSANSPAIIRFPQYHYDMVRLGIGLYGFDPTKTLQLQTVGTLISHISQIKELKEGDTVGYSRKGKVIEDMTIAVIPIGYADGYLRVFGNGVGKVCVGETLVPTVGNICMDMMMVDVTGLEVSVSDRVTIFGDHPTIADLAKWSNTIPYEILTNVSQRVKRIYVSE